MMILVGIYIIIDDVGFFVLFVLCFMVWIWWSGGGGVELISE